MDSSSPQHRTASFAQRVAGRLDALTADAARAHDEDPTAAGLLIALSGGPDSVVLLAVAAEWAAQRSHPLVAAHFNHRLRADQSDQDQAFCQDLCDRLGVRLECTSGDPRAVARQRGRGLEDAARELRLRFLARVREQHGLAVIATGHHRDDQAETVVLRLFRGTGLDGLRGLRPRSGRRIHPLLDETRMGILDELARRGLAWRDDPTNEDGSNRRSRVRRELLPLVRDIFGPGSDLNPARLADLVDADLACLDQLVDDAWRRLAGPALEGHDGTSLDAGGAADLPAALARRLIRRWLAGAMPCDLARAHVDDIRRWLASGRSGTSLDLPDGVRLERVFERVGIVGTAPPRDDATRWRVRLEPAAAAPIEPSPPTCQEGTWRLICPSKVLQGSLRLRNPRPGDHLEPFGLGGTKKLSDLMQERRIPAARRAGLLVVEDDAGILWVPGVVQDERTRLLPSTGQTVTISVDRRPELPAE